MQLSKIKVLLLFIAEALELIILPIILSGNKCFLIEGQLVGLENKGSIAILKYSWSRFIP